MFSSPATENLSLFEMILKGERILAIISREQLSIFHF